MQESYIKNKQTNLYLFQKSHPDLYVQHDWITPGLVSSCYNDVKILLHITNVNNKATGPYTWKAWIEKHAITSPSTSSLSADLAADFLVKHGMFYDAALYSISERF